MPKVICIYLEVHQPFRVTNFSMYDVANDKSYFGSGDREIFRKVAKKSYIPTNKLLLKMLQENPNFKLTLSISGVVLEQMEDWGLDVLQSFKSLVATGKVELLAETYYHSLSSLYDEKEFKTQVAQHMSKLKEVFGVMPQSLRNTELIYNDIIGKWADDIGFKAILAEGWDPVLDWRSPNYVYKPYGAANTKLLLKNYKLSDDIAFRFGNQSWEEWPLTIDKFTHWANENDDEEIINLFMDYETFGEHQWAETGIFEFLSELPAAWINSNQGNTFMTVSEIADNYEAKDVVSMPETVTWADSERDLTAWTGNSMQQQAINQIYGLKSRILESGDDDLIDDWRKLQTSDHFYYMCTKWFNDGDVHAYFSPKESPYEAFIHYMNAVHDLKYRLGAANNG